MMCPTKLVHHANTHYIHIFDVSLKVNGNALQENDNETYIVTRDERKAACDTRQRTCVSKACVLQSPERLGYFAV